MTQNTTLLEEAAQAFAFARQGTIAEAADIPDDRWDYRPHANARSVEELVRHMIEAATILLSEAADPEGDFQRRPPQEHLRAHGGELPAEMSPADLRQALSRSHDEAVRKVREAGEELMAQGIRRFDGGTWSRLTYVFYAASHEDYHRGQLAMYARTMGLVPALTRRIHGDQAT